MLKIYEIIFTYNGVSSSLLGRDYKKKIVMQYETKN